jgi:hypothetical protein
MEKNSVLESGIHIPDHISQILVKICGLKILKFLVSVADPYPGSGAFLTPGSSSVPDPLPAFHFGIRIQLPKVMPIHADPDSQHWDSRSGVEKSGSGIRDKHPGSTVQKLAGILPHMKRRSHEKD